MSDFEEFWERYPRRVGKLDAQKAFRKALKIACLADILGGVDRYIQNKPEYADWAHPATWLNKGRWMDEPDRRQGDRRQADRRQDPESPFGRGWICRHTPPCGNRSTCAYVTERDAKKSGAA